MYVGGCTWGGYTGGYTGWVIRGYTGTTPAPRKEVPVPAKRAPEGLQGLEWVGTGAGCVSLGTVGGDGYDPPYGPGRSTPGGPPWSYPWNCPPTAKGARFDLILLKLSQNDEVSPESV